MFFSVKTSMKIGSKVYTPCICYPLPETLVPTVDKLVKEGKAYRYEERVFFQNGKVLVKNPAVKEEVTVEKSKKVKKGKTVPVADTEELPEEAELPSPEEIADEGF